MTGPTAGRSLAGRSLLAWGVLACGFLFSLFAFRDARVELDERAHLLFERHIESVVTALGQRMKGFETIFRAGAAMFSRSSTITRADWTAFTSELQVTKRYPGALVLTAVLRIPAAELAQHVDHMRAEGFAEYQVRPPGPRDEYFPVVRVEPFEVNRVVLGYDFMSEPWRRVAGERARDTGEPAASEAVQLLQDAGRVPTAAFAMWYPFYRGLPPSPSVEDRRRALAGYMTGAFRFVDLMAAVLPDHRPGMDLAMFESTDGGAETLLYADAPAPTDPPGYQQEVPFPIGGRTWTLRFAARPWLDPSLDTGAPYRVLVTGLVATFLLFLLVRTQGLAERRAHALASEMTAAAREREARLRAVVDNEPECVKIVSPEGVLLEMNAAGLRMCEAASVEEVIGRPVIELIHPDDRQAFRALHDRVVGGESGTLTFRVQGLRGGLRWMETSSVPLHDESGAVTSVLSVTRDVSERRHAEEELRASEERYRQIVETATEGVWIIDAEERTTFVNQRFAEMLGWAARDLIGCHAFEIVAPEARRSVAERLQRRRVGISEQYDIPLLRKDGTRMWGLLSAGPRFDEAGRYAGALAMITDITARREAFEAYRQAQSLISSIVEHSPNIIFVKDAKDLSYVLFNKAGQDLLGRTRDELIGKNDYTFFPKDEADFFTAKDREVLASGRLVEIPDEPILTPRGLRRLRTMKVPILDESGQPRYLLGISEDITDRLGLEDQLRQAQKMEAIGTLAGGLAHDFNNILACVLGYGDLARVDCAGNARALENLARVLEAGERAKGLVEQLLAFAHHRERAREPVDPGAAVASTVHLVRPTLSKSVDVRLDVAPGLPSVLADPTQLHQLVMNLVTNGAQAMEGRGGRLDVAVARIEVSAAMAARELGLSPGPWVRIAVHDEGEGMDDATREHIFEPFYTTKQRGRGVGLGLAVVHGIVQSHGGVIVVRSEPGRGSTFEIYLPVHDGVPAAPAAKREGAVPRGRGERILFVDDEAPLAELGRRVLEGLGYRVTALTDPASALTVFRANPDAFKLVVTDLMMPSLDGTELATEVLRLRPRMPVLLCTAYEAHVPPDVAPRLRGVVTKPNTTEALARAVHDALAAAAGDGGRAEANA